MRLHFRQLWRPCSDHLLFRHTNRPVVRLFRLKGQDALKRGQMPRTYNWYYRQNDDTKIIQVSILVFSPQGATQLTDYREIFHTLLWGNTWRFSATKNTKIAKCANLFTTVANPLHDFGEIYAFFRFLYTKIVNFVRFGS